VSPPEQDIKKFLNLLKVIEEEEKMFLELQRKVWIKHCSMPTETEGLKKETLGDFGYKE
jgi:hypothetical protein